jgi:hypothetical protein
MAEAVKCVQPAKGPVIEGTTDSDIKVEQKEAPKMLARVGKEAPDFELTAFHNGAFKNIRLSDFKGKWIVICFYPGDFTFV